MSLTFTLLYTYVQIFTKRQITQQANLIKSHGNASKYGQHIHALVQVSTEQRSKLNFFDVSKKTTMDHSVMKTLFKWYKTMFAV